MRTAIALACSVSLFGCAAVFRGSKDHVVVDSDPAGAETKRGEQSLGQTPVSFDVPRKGMTQVTLTKKGYDEHHVAVTKKMNGAWLTLDIVTCPLLICIPLLVDAVTGAWFDVDEKYVAHLTPQATATAVAPFAPSASTATAWAPPPPSTPAPTRPPPDMSEGERKANARAAYMAGVSAREKSGCPAALHFFETAQRYYPAPTHLLQIGQCQAATGKLVDASETYETLSRMALANDASDAFRQAQKEGRDELARLKPRVPTLKVQITPAPTSLSGLLVKMNDVTVPNELLGLQRPVNPGTYKVSVYASGYKETSQRIDVGEGASQSVTLTLTK